MKTFIACLFILASTTVSAAVQPYTLNVQNPERDIGYMVGDIIKRTVELETKAPFKLASGSVPVRGVMRNNIELSDVKLTERTSKRLNTYHLEMTYQVFTSSAYAKKIELPRETLQITNAGKNIRVVVPAWNFRISPIAVHGEVYVEQDMSPYRGPLLVETGYLRPALAGFLGLVLISILGLIYINGDPAWFPGMGGPFAASYRKISSLPKRQESASIAVCSIHQAFNQTFGENVFHADVEAFLQRHPSFLSIREDVESFFNLSNDVLFGVNVDAQHANSLLFLIEFCERCRNCERGVA